MGSFCSSVRSFVFCAQDNSECCRQIVITLSCFILLLLLLYYVSAIMSRFFRSSLYWIKLELVKFLTPTHRKWVHKGMNFLIDDSAIDYVAAPNLA